MSLEKYKKCDGCKSFRPTGEIQGICNLRREIVNIFQKCLLINKVEQNRKDNTE